MKILALMAASIVMLSAADIRTYDCKAPEGSTGDPELRAQPAGNSDEHHQFDWNLYDLPRGTWKVTARLKLAKPAASGRFEIAAKTFSPSTELEERTDALIRVDAAAMPTSLATVTGTWTYTNAWPANYVFIRTDNQLKDAAGQPVEVLIDRVDLELEKPGTPPVMPTALRTWTLDFGKPLSGAELKQRIDDWSVALPTGRYLVTSTLRRVGDLSELTGKDMGNPARFRVTLEGPAAGGDVGAGMDAYTSPAPSSFRRDADDQPSFVLNVARSAAQVHVSANHQSGAIAPIALTKVVIRQLEAWTEIQAMAKAKLKPAVPRLIAKPGLQVWRVDGLGSLRDGTAQVLAGLKAETTLAWMQSIGGEPRLMGQVPGRWLLEGGDAAAADAEPAPITAKPKDADPPWVSPTFEDRLMAHDVVILTDLHSRTLSLEMRDALRAYVQGGGGLLLIGGMYGLDRGGYQDSDLLAQVLPCTLASEASLSQLKAPTALSIGEKAAALKGLRFSDAPQAMWLHTIMPKPDAVVELSAGGKPVLITGSAGKGRIAVLAAPPYGVAPGAVRYWESKDWPATYAALIRWLGNTK